MNTSTLHTKIIDRSKELVRILSELIAIPSPPGHEKDVLNYIEDMLRSLGLATSWVDLEQTDLVKHPAFIPTGARQGRNLLGVLGAPKAELKRYPVLFNGHVDVVPPGEASSWSHPPHKLVEQEGQLYGNGAADTKGGISCLLYVFSLLVEQGFEPAKPIAVEFVSDEERLGNGTLANVLAGISAEKAIFLEPSGSDCIVSGHRGAFLFRITIRGEGNEIYSRGTTPAVEQRLVQLFDALNKWKIKRQQQCANLLGEDRAERAPLYFGQISGGHWLTAPLVETHIDGVCAYVPGEQREDVEDAFRKHFSSIPDIAPLVKSGELTISLDRGFVEPAETPQDSPLAASLQKTAGDVLGNRPRIENCINSGCDMRLRRLYDKDCQCLWYGPGGNRCHQSDESVFFEDLVKVSRVLAEWIIRQCGA